MNRTEAVATNAVAPEAEMAVLGAILQDRDALKAARLILSDEDFYRESHRLIFSAICDLSDLRGVPVDLVTVTDELRRRQQLEHIGTSAYLASLIEHVPTASTVSYYAQRVADAAYARRVSDAAQQLYVAARDHTDDWQEHYEAVKHMFEKTNPSAVRQGPITRPMGDVLAEVARASANGDGGPTVGVPWMTLSRRLCGGLAPGELCYLGARPRIGKSAMMLEWARWLAQQGQHGMIVSCEMSLVALGRRIVAQAGAVVASALRRGHLIGEDHARVLAVADEFRSLPVTMVSGARTVEAIEKSLTAQRVKPGIVFVDYLQLLNGKGRDQRERIEAVSRSLKQLAVDHMCPVVCLSSLRRAHADAKDAAPTLNDLRDSGELEHDADVILLLHRPLLSTGMLSPDGMCIIAKARDAEMGMVKMRFDTAYLRYSEVTEREQ